MYICICNAIREADLRDLARDTPDPVEALYARLGKTPQCRQCIEDAEDVVAEARNCTLA